MVKYKIIKDLQNGNPLGQGYTIKEILTEHIRHDADIHNELSNDIKEIKTELRRIAEVYATKQFVYSLFGMLASVVTFIAYQIFK